MFSYILLGWFYHLTIVLNYFVHNYNTAFLACSTLLLYYFQLCNCASAFSCASLPSFWYQSHSFLANDSVVMFSVVHLCCPKLWYSVVVFPSYRRWCIYLISKKGRDKKERNLIWEELNYQWVWYNLETLANCVVGQMWSLEYRCKTRSSFHWSGPKLIK